MEASCRVILVAASNTRRRDRCAMVLCAATVELGNDCTSALAVAHACPSPYSEADLASRMVDCHAHRPGVATLTAVQQSFTAGKALLCA